MKLKKLNKWHVVVGGFISYAFDALDITILSLCLPLIMLDLNISMSQGGFLGTATLIGVGLSSIVVGWYSDNYGRRKAFLFSLISFGVLTAAIAFSPNWIVILILRFLSGLGLGGLWGIIAAYVAETWPSKQRGRAAAFVLSSFPVGTGIASFLAVVVIPHYGWRGLFLTGGAAIFAALYIYFFVPESEEWAKQKQERINKGDTKNISVTEIFEGKYLRITVLATLTSFLLFVGYWGSITWLPTFLVNDRGIDTQTMYYFMIIFSVGQFFGYMVMGYISDIIGRKYTIMICYLGMAIMLPIYIMATNPMFILLLGPIYAFFATLGGLFGSYFGELYPTRIRTLGAGFCLNIGRGFSAISPLLLGIIATGYGLLTGLIVCGIIYIFGVITTMFLPDTRTYIAQ